jgi:hypothetical protein
MEQFTQSIKSNYLPAACERHGVNVPVKILSFKKDIVIFVCG